MECVMNRFSLIFLCMLASAQITCPMAENSPSWMQRIKNSLSSIYSRAVAYCSLKKQPQPLQRHAQISAMLAAQANGTQEKPEKIRLMPWTPTLKSVPSKQANPQEDNIQNPIIIKKDIPLFNKPAHLLGFNDTQLGKEFANSCEKHHPARMLEASDYLLTNHTRADETPIKHAGLLIDKRSNELYKEHKLARYSYDEKTSIKTIFINGKCTTVNEMIVCQYEEHLSQPAIYVTLKHNDAQALEQAQVSFTTHNQDLFVKISNADQYDIELHLPRRMDTPFIKYLTQQVKALAEIKQ